MRLVDGHKDATGAVPAEEAQAGKQIVHGETDARNLRRGAMVANRVAGPGGCQFRIVLAAQPCYPRSLLSKS